MHNPTFRKKVGLLSGLIVLLMALVLVLTWGKDLDERHRPVEFAEAFDFSVGTFADYTAYSERRLRAAHAEAPAEVITNLAPSPVIREVGVRVDFPLAHYDAGAMGIVHHITHLSKCLVGPRQGSALQGRLRARDGPNRSAHGCASTVPAMHYPVSALCAKAKSGCSAPPLT